MDALLDANVLYSIVLTDVLLELSRDRLLQPVWSEAILREAERAVAARGSVDAAAVQRRFAAMRRYFPSAMVDAVEYEPLVHQMRNHDGDRHVLAAAVAARVDVLVTCNVKHARARPWRICLSAGSPRRTPSSARSMAWSRSPWRAQSLVW